MSEHFRAYSAVFPIIIQQIDGQESLLLHRRQNTGYMDGKWDFAGSGHVDEGETARTALIRECGEELGIGVAMDDIAFCHLSHGLSLNRTYYDIYFLVKQYIGVPKIMEPDKCSELAWFSADHLPEDMIACRRRAFEAVRAGVFYSESIEI